MSGHLTREEKNLWKDQIEQSRFSDFNELKLWLKNKGIVFEEKSNGINLNHLFISDLLKVYFDGTRKGYQYNLDSIKERLVNDLGLSI
jgi:hypothetical protein